MANSGDFDEVVSEENPGGVGEVVDVLSVRPPGLRVPVVESEDAKVHGMLLQFVCVRCPVIVMGKYSECCTSLSVYASCHCHGKVLRKLPCLSVYTSCQCHAEVHGMLHRFLFVSCHGHGKVQGIPLCLCVLSLSWENTRNVDPVSVCVSCHCHGKIHGMLPQFLSVCPVIVMGKYTECCPSFCLRNVAPVSVYGMLPQFLSTECYPSFCLCPVIVMGTYTDCCPSFCLCVLPLSWENTRNVAPVSVCVSCHCHGKVHVMLPQFLSTECCPSFCLGVL